MSPSNERSAEWLRGRLAEVRHLEGECDVVFRGDQSHVTRMALCERADELKALLAEAEAREASQPTAAEVIEAAWWALQPFARGGVIDCLSRDDYSVMKERIVDWHGPSDFRAAVAAADLCTRWKEANGG